MTTGQVIAALVVMHWFHWLFDFVWQTNQMAMNKSSSNRWLGKHVLVWTGGVALWGAMFNQQGLVRWVVFVALNAALHFATDYVTSRQTSKLWFFRPIALKDLPPGAGSAPLYAFRGFHVPKDGGDRHWFFVTIGYDQALHFTVLLVTSWWLLF